MDTMSAAALARELGTSVPRVTRAASRLGIGSQPSGRFAFAPRQTDLLRRELGTTPPVEGLTRSEVLVLAALRSAPYGLASIRAVARRGGLSATAAGGALRALAAEGLVERSTEMVAAGRARRMAIWRSNPQHPRWPALDPALDRVQGPDEGRDRPRRVPGRLRHLFWNVSESQLDVANAGPFIATRLLRTMDLQGLAWGARALAPEAWERAAGARGLDPGTRRLAMNLAEAAR